jgi:enediyne biosynthesis protein E8
MTGEATVQEAAQQDLYGITITLEAYADTVLPGEKRWPGDRAIAGISEGSGAVAAGAIELVQQPEGGMAPLLEDVAAGLNAHAERYIKDHGIEPDDSAAPFVTLSGEHRTALVQEITAWEHPEKQLWIGLALFFYMAYDAAAYMSTTDALAQGHPGLKAMDFLKPDADGLWRAPEFSYRRPLAKLHPDTLANGSL